jgi:hypothetical protein
MAMQADNAGDPFDTLYDHWANYALDKNTDPPSKRRWDEAVYFLLRSEDPTRRARYRRIASTQQGSLGADAYDLWKQLPDYTPDKHAPVKKKSDLSYYAAVNAGSMARYMEAMGQGERYRRILAEQAEIEQRRREKARRGQTGVIIIGCVALASIAVMILTVFLIIALRMAG